MKKEDPPFNFFSGVSDCNAIDSICIDSVEGAMLALHHYCITEKEICDVQCE